jgi:hypothetical protein
MVPDADLQLQVVIKALQETVAPALDGTNRLAVEQMHLSIATLTMLKSRLPLLHGAARQELANAVTLATAASSASGGAARDGLYAAVESAQGALGDSAIATSELAVRKSELLAATSTFIEAHGAMTVDLLRAVVTASKPQFDLARAWCIGAGFEPDPQEVPPLDTLLG